MCMSTPSMPKAPPPPPEPLKTAATDINAAVADQQKKASLLAGLNNTVKTGSGAGISTTATTAVKSLLGQ